jgi:stress response protein YsnF
MAFLVWDKAAPIVMNGRLMARARSQVMGAVWHFGTSGVECPFPQPQNGWTMQEPSETLHVVNERAVVEKHHVVTGKVRVSTRTETTTELVSAVLNEDSVAVERVPVNRHVETVPDVRVEDGVTIIPVVEEVLVVERRLVLREELHVRRTVSQKTVEEPVTVRKQRVVIERNDGETQPSEEDISNEPDL